MRTSIVLFHIEVEEYHYSIEIEDCKHMKLNFKKPHNLFSRLLQLIVVVLFFGLLYMGIKKAESIQMASAIPVVEPEILSVTTPSSKTGKMNKDSDSGGESETETMSKSSSDDESEAISESSSGNETEALSESSSDDESEVTSESGTEDSEEQKSYSLITPYTEPDDPLLLELLGTMLLQPDYLSGVTKLSITWRDLEDELTSMLNDYSGDWSVYIKDISNDSVISINDRPMESASLIKLYIMGAVMEQIKLGNLEKTDKIYSLLSDMITVSDNEASNELVRYLGEDHSHKDGLTYINAFAKRYGFTSTQQVNGLNDSSLWYNSSDTNRTSARDCGELLTLIYDGELVSHMASRKMEEWLLGQKVRYKIPAALPSEALSASKTGEIDEEENDVAIIYSPEGDFILCIMSGDWNSKNQAIDHIHDITELVYSYFNPPKTENYKELSTQY